MLKQNGKIAFEQFLKTDKYYLENFVKISGLYCYIAKRLKGKEKKTEKQSLLNSLEKTIKNGLYFYDRIRINDLKLLNKIAHSDKTDIRLLSTSIDPSKLSPEDILKLYESNKEKDREIANLKKINKTANKDLYKFISTKKQNENAIDIYLRVIKLSDKIPTYDALAIASARRISSSTWHRKLTKDLGFLYTLKDEIEKLINRTSIESKKMFYRDVYNYIDSIYTELQIKEFEYRTISKTIKSEKDSSEISVLDYITDRMQYDDFSKSNE